MNLIKDPFWQGISLMFFALVSLYVFNLFVLFLVLYSTAGAIWIYYGFPREKQIQDYHYLDAEGLKKLSREADVSMKHIKKIMDTELKGQDGKKEN